MKFNINTIIKSAVYTPFELLSYLYIDIVHITQIEFAIA